MNNTKQEVVEQQDDAPTEAQCLAEAHNEILQDVIHHAQWAAKQAANAGRFISVRDAFYEVIAFLDNNASKAVEEA